MSKIKLVLALLLTHAAFGQGIGGGSGPGTGTVTSIATGCGLSGGTVTTTGTISQAILTAAHNGSYAILTGDCGKSLTTNTAAAWTIAQAGTTGFEAGKFWTLQNVGSGSLTVTATTSTFYGGPTAQISGSVLTVAANSGATILSDGANFQVISGQTGSRDVHIVPFAASPGASPATGITYASGWTPTNRAGTNNIGAALQAIPSTGGTLYFELELPADWATANQPYIRLQYASGANTTGTVIWTVSSACTKSDGSVSDDPAYVAESAFAAQTMAAANRAWAQTGQFTGITSGNNCIAGSPVIFRAVLSGTAGSAINAYQAVVTIPTLTNPGQAE